MRHLQMAIPNQRSNRMLTHHHELPRYRFCYRFVTYRWRQEDT